MKRIALLAPLCAFVALSAVASPPATQADGDTAPQSLSAKEAAAKLAHARADAETAYRRSMFAAYTAYAKDLQEALDKSMAVRNLDEAKRIEAALLRAKSLLLEFQNIPDAPKTFTIKAGPKTTWQETVRVRKGDRLLIEAKGQWFIAVDKKISVGPDGTADEDGTLYGRIGTAAAFRVGSKLELKAQQDGILTLAMKDPDGMGHADDAGSLEVTIKILERGPLIVFPGE
jgi:hypothetical protein